MAAPAAESPTRTHAVTAADYRKVLGRVPTAVSVVTAQTPDGPVGVTVGSFTSVSLEPPLVVFYCDLRSASAASVVAAGRFCVNVLADDQQRQCGAFASRTGDRFASCSWEPAANGAPRIHGSLAWIECDVENSFPAGDHIAILGRVRRLSAAAGDRKPLVFYRGRLVQLDSAGLRHAPTHTFSWWDA
ncbi:flavin reductase family protein [Kitasatospora sp. NPDC057223]|uniref:flavin reductase family protein n=1 Tax=Kitasatospora sp. NPDC057223 TaxID=3346055 RepID=UPI0036344FD9